MKSWIKIGAICEVRGQPGVLHQIDWIDEDKKKAKVRRLDIKFYGSVSLDKLARTNLARSKEKKMYGETTTTKDKDLAQARLLAERHGYAVVRKMP